MTEQEYVTLSNLSRVKDALNILIHYIPDDDIEEQWQEATKKLCIIENFLSCKIQIGKE